MSTSALFVAECLRDSSEETGFPLPGERFTAVLFDVPGTLIQSFYFDDTPRRWAILDAETDDFYGRPRLFSSSERAERAAEELNDLDYSRKHQATALVSTRINVPLPNLAAKGKDWDKSVRQSMRYQGAFIVECLSRSLATGSRRGLAIDLSELRRLVWLLAYPEDWGSPSYIPDDQEVFYCEECGLPITEEGANYPNREEWRPYDVPAGPICEGCFENLRETCEPVNVWEIDPDFVMY